MFVWIVVLLATANTTITVEFLLNFRTSYASYCMGVRPNKAATIDIVRLLSVRLLMLYNQSGYLVVNSFHYNEHKVRCFDEQTGFMLLIVS